MPRGDKTHKTKRTFPLRDQAERRCILGQAEPIAARVQARAQDRFRLPDGPAA